MADTNSNHAHDNSGVLSWLFGQYDHARVNIAGMIVIIAVVGEFALFVSLNRHAAEFAAAVTPVITLALGYIFGKSAPARSDAGSPDRGTSAGYVDETKQR